MKLDWGKLRGQLAEQGLTILAGAVGGPGGAIAATVGRELAKRLGVTTPEEVEERLATPEGREIAVTLEAERGESLVVLARTQQELAMAEMRSESAFQSAWRPAMSWLLGLMWLWTGMILPTVRGITGIAIEGMPYDQLLAFTGIWLTIYGGGHTLKSIMGPKA